MMVKRRLPTIMPVCAAVLISASTLGGCSWVPDAVNPVSWYRDLSGASKNDALDQDKSNQQNLAAGGKQPYPNLADVPNAPDRALSTIDRDTLQKSLIADRTNAQYTDETLRAGTVTPGTVIPPPPETEAALGGSSSGDASAASQQAQPAQEPPAESSLKSPAIAAVPQGEAPLPPPPPPEMPATAPKASPTTPVKSAEIQPPAAGQRHDVAASAVEVAAITFATDSADLTDADRNHLSEIAALQHAKGGAFHVIGHAPPAGDAAPQKLASFQLAMNRAKAVAQALTSEGVPAQAIAVDAAPSEPGDNTGAVAQVFLEH